MKEVDDRKEEDRISKIVGSNNSNNICHLKYVIKLEHEKEGVVGTFIGGGRVWNVEWHPEKYLLASCGGKVIKLWRPAIDEYGIEEINNWYCCQIFAENVHRRTIRAVSFTSEGRSIAVASFDSTISIWNETQNQDCIYQLATIIEGHENEVKSVSWDPITSAKLASCSRDKTVWIHAREEQFFDNDKDIDPEAKKNSDYNINTEQEEFYCVSVLSGHTQDVKHVKWHPVSSNVIATGSYDNTVRIWYYDETINEWAERFVLEDHTDTVWCVCFSNNGLQIASCSNNGIIKIWTCLLSHSNNCKEIKNTHLIDNNDNNFSLKREILTNMWDLNPTFKRLAANVDKKMQIETNIDETENLKDYTKSTNEKYNEYLPSNFNDVCYNNCNWTCTTTLSSGNNRQLYSIDWSNEDDLLAAASADKSIYIFGPKKNNLTENDITKCINIKENNSEQIFNSELLYEHNRQKQILNWELKCKCVDAHSADVNSVRWRKKKQGSRSRLLVSGGDDGKICIWEYTY